MVVVKSCEQCGVEFPKPCTVSRAKWQKRRFCSLVCKSESQKGQTSPRKGKTYGPHVPNGHPCRICGERTRYYGKKVVGLVHCGKPECKDASKRIKNQAIGRTHAELSRQGLKVQHGWKLVPLVSRQERELEPWFRDLGWDCQYKVLTRVSSVRLPRFAQPDFALPACKLFVEIDGTSHRFPERKARDERRDSLLAAIGWRGLRIPAQDVAADPEGVKQRIRAWVDNSRRQDTTVVK